MLIKDYYNSIAAIKERMADRPAIIVKRHKLNKIILYENDSYLLKYNANSFENFRNPIFSN